MFVDVDATQDDARPVFVAGPRQGRSVSANAVVLALVAALRDLEQRRHRGKARRPMDDRRQS